MSKIFSCYTNIYIKYLQQSKLRNESNENIGLCPFERLFFPPRRKRVKRVCGRKDSKGEKSLSTKEEV